MTHDPTPAALGFRMPAEWEPHLATWFSWPRPDSLSFAHRYERVKPALVHMVAALANSGETVRINVADAGMEAHVRAALAPSLEPGANVEYFRQPTNEPWCRDHGPTFVKRDTDGARLILDWGYNAWGGKYPPFDLDDAIPAQTAAKLGLPFVTPGLIMEGGSIEPNGSGALLTTESCLLNPNRNPAHTKEQIEEALRAHLGVRHILWLGDGIVGDDTDGHIDDLTRFVSPDTVVTVVEENPSDINHAILRENLHRLLTMRTETGEPLRVIELPMPAPIFDDEDDSPDGPRRLPASYANFYIGNHVVLLPVFNDPEDERARAILQSLFPTRRVIPVNCREIIWGLGAIHCLSQQEPA